MTIKRLTLTGLRVDGNDVASAGVDFQPGLNVVVGASETGKSYVANTIDFLLGGSTPPPDVPISKKYSRGYLGIKSNFQSFTISRDFRDNSGAYLHRYPLEQADLKNAAQQLSAVHKTGSKDSLSYFLLNELGLIDKQLRKDQYANKAALTMRQIAHLCVVSEEKIISKISPVLSGNSINAPLERSVFSFFITGNDEADLTTLERPKDMKARLQTEATVLTTILEEKKAALRKLVGEDTSSQQRLLKLESSISEATKFISAKREEIAALEQSRNDSWAELQKLKSRKLFIAEQLKRLKLLGEFYETDRKRLEAILEAGAAFEQVPGGGCAVCGSKTDKAQADAPIEQFKTACIIELKKLDSLSKELAAAVQDMEEEDAQNGKEAKETDGRLAEAEKEIAQKLRPQTAQADFNLTELVKLKGDVSRAVDLEVEISGLLGKLGEVEKSKKTKKPKTTPTGSIGTAKAARFCEVVQSTLLAWKYPLRGNVSFDPGSEKFDLVIGEQDRGSMGKGYRAITYAAFVIGLMRYCRAENIPHPGFVVLDTPLNPLKGPDEGSAGNVNEEIKHAFYENLAKDASGDQFIILENFEPSPILSTSIKYHHFSRNPEIGRFGFFPIKPTPRTQAS